jgi:hypothetical protein
MRGTGLLGLALSAALAGCSTLPSGQTIVSHPRPAPPSHGTGLPTPSPTPRVRLVRWHGPVEQLFVHPLVLRPRLAFTSDTLGQGFAHYFVTAREFRRMLDQLWRNRWTLVDPRAVAAGDVRVPAGRRPLVLQEDDVNYYDYFRGRGLASRLVLDGDTVKAEYDHRLTTDDVVPLVDAMVAAHPAFSAAGAKGLLAVTAYEGFFGEHDLADPAARARVRALAAHLRATGWVIASHTYGHIDLSRDSLPVIARDTRRWLAAANGLLGPVHILVYPFGARPSAAGLALLRDFGFRVQYDIDVTARRAVVHGVVVMSRRHVDGYAFDGNARSLAPFFDVSTVRDRRRP